MNSKPFIFAAGAAVGSVVTWFVLKDKYKKIADDEINSVKDTFSKETKRRRKMIKIKENVLVGGEESEPVAPVDPGYSKADDEDRVVSNRYPYIINPNDFDDPNYDSYDKITLTYYADGVLTDEVDEPIAAEDIQTFVGTEFMTHFGEFDPDVVYVRNDILRIDYEIVRDEENFVTKPDV